MRERTPEMIYDDIYMSALSAELRKSKNICDNCFVSADCKYHNNPKNKSKVVRDCGKFRLSDEVLEEIEKEWRKETHGKGKGHKRKV